MKETNKIKRIVRPLCVYSLAFSLALPSLTGIVEAATYTSTTQKLVATVAAQNEVGGGTQNTASIPEEQENKDFTIDTVVNTETKAIKGTGKPGAKIKITDASGVIVGKEANVGKDGKWSATIPKDKRPLKEGTEFTVTQTVNGNAPTSQTIRVKKSMAEENKDDVNGIDFSKLKTIWTDGKNPSLKDLERLLDYIKTKNQELGAKISKVKVNSGKLQLIFTDGSKLDLTKDPKEIFKQKKDTPEAIVDPIYPGARVISGKLPEGVDKKTVVVKVKLGGTQDKHAVYKEVEVKDDGTFSYTIPEGKTVPDVITVSIEEKGSDSDQCHDGMQCKDPSRAVETEHNTQMDPAKTLVGDPEDLTLEEETAVKTAVKEAMKEKNGGTDPTGVEVAVEGNNVLIKNGKGGVIGSWPVKDLIAKKVKDPEVTVNKEDKTVTARPDKDDDVANKMEVTYTPAGSETPATIVATKGSDNKWKLPDGTDSAIKIDESTGVVTLPKEKVKEGTEVTAKTVDKSGNKSKDVKTTIKPDVPKVKANKDNGDVSVSPSEGTSFTEITYTPGGKGATETTVTVKKNDQGTWEFEGLTGTPQEGTGYIVTDSGLVLDPNTGVVNIPKGSAKENSQVKAKSKTSTNVTSLESKDTVPDKTPPATPTVAAKDDGSVEIIVPTDDTTELVINYKDQDGKPKTAMLKKEQGNWSIPRESDLELDRNTGNFLLPKDKVKGGSEVSVIAKDAAENKSNNGTATTKAPETKAPEKPTVTVKDDGSVEVTPLNDADVNEVVVKYLDKESGTEKTVTAKKDTNGDWTVTPNDVGVTVDANGKVTVPSDKIKGGTTITATTKNKSGKDSQPVTETVKPDAPKVNADPTTGSVTITPSFNADSMEIKYTPVGDNATKKTITVTKGNDNKWKLSEETKDLTIDEDSGLVTIAKGNAKENTKVTAKAKIGTTLVSTEGETTVSTSGGTTPTPGQATRPSKPTISDNAGTIEITPVGDVDEMEVTFTPTESDKPITLKAKIENGTWVIEGQTPDGVSIKNGVVTIAKGKAKEGTDIKAKTIHGQEVSEEATTKVPSTTPLPNPNPQDPSEDQGNDPGKVSQPIIEKDNSGNTTVTPKDPNTGSVTIDIVDKDGNQRQVTAEKGKNGKWSLVNNKPEFDISGIKIDSDTGKVTIPSQILGDKGKVTASAKALSDNSYKPSYEENEIPEIKVRDHYTPTYPVYVTVPKTEKVEKAKEVPVSLETHKAYIAGYEDKTLRAEGNLTRAEAAAMVTRLAGLDLSDTSMPKFKDMQKNAWYFRYINAAVKANMLDADNGMMRPNDKITRAEFAKMLAAIDKENSSVSKFDDIKGHRYEKEINKIYGNNRIEGYEDGSFRPDAYLTRAESAAFLNRMFNRIADKEAYAGLEDKLAKFKDFDASKWYYDEMVEATNSHELTRRGKASDKFGRVYEKWTRILPSDVK